MKILIILAFLLSFQTFAQEKNDRLLEGDKNYHLVSKRENSDLNYKLFKQFGDTKIYFKDKIKKAYDLLTWILLYPKPNSLT